MQARVHIRPLVAAVKNLTAILAQGVGIKEPSCKISTGKDCLLVESSGGGAYFSSKIPATVKKSGEFMIGATYFSSIVFPAAEAEFVVSKEELQFQCGRVKANLRMLLEKEKVERVKDDIKEAVILDAGLFNTITSSLMFSPIVADHSLSLRFTAKKRKDLFRVITADQFRSSLFRCGSEWVTEPKSDKAKNKKGPDRKFNIKIKGDFDFSFPSEFLRSINGVFSGDLTISANDKLVRFDDGTTLLYHPSSLDNVGERVDPIIDHINNTKPDIETTFDPSRARDILDSVTSVSSVDDMKFKIEVAKKKIKLEIQTSDNNAKASGIIDPIETKREGEFYASYKYILEMLSLVSGFAKKDGAKLRVYQKCIVLDSNKAMFIVPRVKG